MIREIDHKTKYFHFTSKGASGGYTKIANLSQANDPI